jgi:hypothetical protein
MSDVDAIVERHAKRYGLPAHALVGGTAIIAKARQDVVAELRSKGLTQKAVADALGITKQAVSLLERQVA